MTPETSRQVGWIHQFIGADDCARLAAIRKWDADLWAQGSPLHPLFTLHGEQHSSQVEKILGEILAPSHREHHHVEKMLKPNDLFCLVASAWLHDTGMVAPATAEEEERASKAGKPIAEWVRDEHHRRSYRYVLDHAIRLGLDEVEASVVATLCRAHRGENVTSDETLKTSHLDTRFLAALLRIADELDISAARTPEPLLELRWKELDRRGRWHWVKHWCVYKMEPHYKEIKDEAGPVFELTYDAFLRLPGAKYKTPFIERIVAPVRRVVEKEGVGAVLRQRGLAIGYGAFDYTIVHAEVLPGGESLGEALDDLLELDCWLLGDLGRASLAVLKASSVGSAVVLQMQCRRLGRALAGSAGDADQEIRAVIDRFLDQLMRCSDVPAVERVAGDFRDKGRAALREISDRGNSMRDVTAEWLLLVESSRRLMILRVGDAPSRMAQLTYFLHCFTEEYREVIAEVSSSDPSQVVRAEAVALLETTSDPELASKA